MKKKISTLLALLLIVSLVLTGCGGSKPPAGGGEAAKTYTIKVATWFDPTHPGVKSLEVFKEIVEKETNGNVKVNIFPSSQLGSEEVYIDSVKNGTVEMGVTGTMINRYAPLIAFAEYPFLFDDWDHAKKAYFEAGFGDLMAEGIVEKSGFRVMGWAVNGWRMVSSSKPIEKFEDFRGLRLRVPNVPYYIKMAEGLGANPIAMSFSELFTALEQRVVDGQDNPYATVRASSFFEVQPYMVHTGHIFTPNAWIMNEKFYQGLPEDYRNAVDKAVEEALAYNWKISQENEEGDVQFLKDKGIKIVVPDAEFRNKIIESQKVNEQWWFDTYPGTDKLLELVNSLR